MDCSPPGSSVHEILQARILEWVAMPFSRGSSWPKGRTQVSCIAGRFFTIWATRKTQGTVGLHREAEQSLKVMWPKAPRYLHTLRLKGKLLLQGNPNSITHGCHFCLHTLPLQDPLRLGLLGLSIGLAVMKGQQILISFICLRLLVSWLEAALGFLAASSACWFVMSSQSALFYRFMFRSSLSGLLISVPKHRHFIFWTTPPSYLWTATDARQDFYSLYLYFIFIYYRDPLCFICKEKKHRILQVCSRFSLALFVNLREFTQKVKSGRD